MLKTLSIFLVSEALTGLIYYRPAGKNLSSSSVNHIGVTSEFKALYFVLQLLPVAVSCYNCCKLLPVATIATSHYNCYQLLQLLPVATIDTSRYQPLPVACYKSLPVATSCYNCYQSLPVATIATSCYNCYQSLPVATIAISCYQSLPVASRWIQAVAVAFPSVAAGCHYKRIAVLFLLIYCYSKGVIPPP